LALPLVLWLMHSTGGGAHTLDILVPLAGGVGIGVAIPWVANRLEGSRWFGAHAAYRPLAAFAIALLVFSLSVMVHANEFLAAFAAGVTVISVRPDVSREFREFIENIASLLKFAGLFIFGALLSPEILRGLGWQDYVFAALALLAVRPVVLSLALVGTGMSRRDRTVAAFFGPRGFASVLYAVLVLRAGVPSAGRLFDLAAVVITASIVLYSSTDVLAARWLLRGAPRSADR